MMNRRGSVDPSWTLESSENCLLELRQSSARSLSLLLDDDGASTTTMALPRLLVHDVGDDDDAGGGDTAARSAAEAQLGDEELPGARGDATTAAATPVGGEITWDVEFRRTGSTSSSDPTAATGPSPAAEGRRQGFFARRWSSGTWWLRSGSLEGAHRGTEATDNDDDEAWPGDVVRQEEGVRDEMEASTQLARQLYEFSSPSDFLSHLEQILNSRSSYENDDENDIIGGDNDGSNNDMDEEFGDFQSATAAPHEGQGESAAQQQQQEVGPDSNDVAAAPVDSVSERESTVAPKSRIDAAPTKGDDDGSNKVGTSDGCASQGRGDRGVDADPSRKEATSGTTPAAIPTDASEEVGSATTTTSPTMSTPVLIGRVDSILERCRNRGPHDDAASAAADRAANDSSGDATCDTHHLVQFTDSLLLVKGGAGAVGLEGEADGTAAGAGRDQLIEEKKEECLSVDETPRFSGFASGEQQDVSASVRASSGRTPTCTAESDPSLSSCSHESQHGGAEASREGTDRSPSLDDDDDSAAVPFAARGKEDLDQPKVPEIIVAPCIPAETPSLGRDERTMPQSELERIEGQRLASRLSMQLPVRDLTTLEGRFTRRRQQQQQVVGEASSTTATAPDDSSLHLPSFYYSSTIDDTVHVLRSLPWNLLESDEDRAQWDEGIESKLRELDGSLSDVQARIGSSLSTKDLEAVNNLVHEWQTDLDLALMYADRAKGSLDGILDQQDDVDQLWRQRGHVRELHSVLECVDGFVQEKLDLDSRIAAFDVGSSNEYEILSRVAQHLASRAAESPLSDLRSLEGLRADVQSFPRRFWDRMLALNRATTISACRSEECDVARQRQMLNQVLELDRGRAADGSIDYRKEWSDSTLDTLCCEADRALAEVLFDCGATDSSLEQFIEPLKTEFNNAGSDRTRIRAITHNLVILRFQMSFSNLAHVADALLSRMGSIICGHQQLIGVTVDGIDATPLASGIDERTRDKEMIRSICTDLQECRRDVWDHCVNVLVRFFNEYYSFAAPPPLFEGDDDSRWSQDLDCLRQVLALVERFLSMRSTYVEGASAEPGDHSLAPGSDLHESLRNVLLRHLRGLHVEAMNATGRMLSSETWILEPADLTQLNGAVDVTAAVLSLANRMASVISVPPMKQACHLDVTAEGPGQSHPSAPPFKEPGAGRLEDPADASDAVQLSASDLDVWGMDLADLISTCIEAQDGRLRLLAPRCVTAGLLQWIARLYTVMKVLPLVVEEASSVLVDLLDLHVTTACRLCCGSAKIEKILLGTVKPAPFATTYNDVRSPQHRPQSASSPLFSSRLKAVASASQANGSKTEANSSLPAALDAEICSPLLQDLKDVLRLRGFLLRAQDGLRDVVNLDQVDSWLPERGGGGGGRPASPEASYEERCCTAAQVLEKRASALLSCNALALAVVAGLVDAQRRLDSSTRAGALEPLGNYARALVSVLPTLWATAGKYACVRAIGGADVVRGVVAVGSKWRSTELQEDPNEYVFDASERCALVWGYLCLSRKLSPSTRSRLWTQMVSGAHQSLLEGFARVSGTTTEGRSLMMLDLGALTGELSGASVTDRLDARSILAPPPTPVPRESRVDGAVETYVKMTYFPKADAVAWMEESVDSYRLHHLVGLAGELADDPDDRLRLVQRVRQLCAERENDIVEERRGRASGP